ncbi:MAG: tyrosine-type recombinase/integrase [Myxococcales bacterium]|nr:tyrosine-type recombinase/integrase [Myxococcales bacterium]
MSKYVHDQTGNPRTGYVLRGPKGTRIKSINRSWENVRAAAGIPDVRLHDLRHSFASDALMCGVPLAVVGAMLGHKHDRTTQRYAHLANDVVRDGLEAATDRIVIATRAVAVLPPPPFERLTDREWKRIGAMVEATRGTCGGPRTDLQRVSTRSAGSCTTAPSGVRCRGTSAREALRSSSRRAALILADERDQEVSREPMGRGSRALATSPTGQVRAAPTSREVVEVSENGHDSRTFMQWPSPSMWPSDVVRCSTKFHRSVMSVLPT